VDNCISNRHNHRNSHSWRSNRNADQEITVNFKQPKTLFFFLILKNQYKNIKNAPVRRYEVAKVRI
jgi:hypothetical protein